MADDVTKIPDTTAAETDPVSVAEADAAAKEPEVNVSPAEAADASSDDSKGGTPPLSEDLPPAPSGDSDGSGDNGDGTEKGAAVDGSEPVSTAHPLDTAVATEAEGAPDPTLPPSTDGTAGATGASAPAADEEKPAEEPDAYEGLHSVAKPLADALGADITESIRKAGNALFVAKEKIDAADLEEVQGDAYWILSNLRNQAVGVLAAVESIFKRTR